MNSMSAIQEQFPQARGCYRHIKPTKQLSVEVTVATSLKRISRSSCSRQQTSPLAIS